MEKQLENDFRKYSTITYCLKAMKENGDNINDMKTLHIVSRTDEWRHDYWGNEHETTICNGVDAICSNKDFTQNRFNDSELPFTLWTKKHVYFPAMYDGSVWVTSVPRNPPDPPFAKNFVGGD